MFLIYAVIAGVIVAVADTFIFRKGEKFVKLMFALIADALFCNLAAMYVCNIIDRCFNAESDGTFGFFPVMQLVTALIIGFIYIFVNAIADGKIYFEKQEQGKKKGVIAIKVLSIVFFALGCAALTGTIWGKEVFGELTPDQMIINLFSPTEGTSDDIMDSLWTGPVLQTIAMTFVFICFSLSSRIVKFTRKSKDDLCIFPILARRIVSIVLSVAILIGGFAYGIAHFELFDIIKMYVVSSNFIEDNFADPTKVKMQFPEKKRNLIHIYLESMENTFASKDLGGYMDENLIKPLTDLAKEGVSFSHQAKGFGGAVSTPGCTWSVASMVNMNTGLPMKVPVGGNDYGSPDNFLPGATTIGDILEAQGYEQSLMFGATAKFGGLNYFYESHGNFNILDHDGAKEKGWIPEDYNVWWGYEDDKLFEFAKIELTRLYETGKPFNFVMETADTHFPDGYVSPNTPMTRDSQYANVVAYSAEETVKFVRWIQEQPFYENTTIILIGDHNSMDKTFFKGFDKSYTRTTFNLILNPANDLDEIPQERRQNRWWANFDMFPTILASIGVKIDGERLGVGTNLFSGEPTLFEEHGGEEGWKYVGDAFGVKSEFYNENILVGDNKPFNNKNVTYY